ALLFRANGDLQNSSKNKITTLQNFMRNLYKKDTSEYVTLSKQEILSADSIKNVVHISADSVSVIFPKFYFNKTKNVLINSNTGDSLYFEKGNGIIAGLKQRSLYIFK